MRTEERRKKGVKTGESSSEEESRRQFTLQIETAIKAMFWRENMVLAFGRPESHGVDARWFIPLGDGSPSPHPLPSYHEPKATVKIFDLCPTWLRDLHYQMQVAKPCVGRVGRVIRPKTYPTLSSGRKIMMSPGDRQPFSLCQ